MTSGGRVLPLSNGTTEITARQGGQLVKVSVVCTRLDEILPVHFGNQVVPILTKMGCNSGGCHGKASGQGGFKLSLLGFDPSADYAAALVKGAARPAGFSGLSRF